MKKNWTNPELESLNISETAGGPILNEVQDGPEWRDENGNWQIPVGEDDISV